MTNDVTATGQKVGQATAIMRFLPVFLAWSETEDANELADLVSLSLPAMIADARYEISSAPALQARNEELIEASETVINEIEHRGYESPGVKRAIDGSALIKVLRLALDGQPSPLREENQRLKAQLHTAETVAAQTRLDEFDKILDPVRKWYDQEGKETDTAKMLRQAIADLQLDRAAVLASAAQRDELLETMQEIAKGCGQFSLDPLEHASNTIEDMKGLARAALASGAKGGAT